MKHVTPENNIRVLKVGSCLSLSGKSTLTYHIGCNDESEIQFRIITNTGGGFFSNEWISLNAILQAFEKKSVDKPIVSLLLFPLFQGKSLNSPAFLFAVLKEEGLITPLEDHPKHYQQLPSDTFIAEIGRLIQSKVDLNIDDNKKIAASKRSKSKS